MENRRTLIGTASLAALLLAMASGGTSGERSAGPVPPAGPQVPAVKRDCSTCHLPEGPGKARGLKIPLSQLCLYCHRDRIAPAEHKVDIVPAMDVKGLPLTDGRMTCSTCHDMHTNANGSMLRMPGRDLCLACHPK